MPGLLPHPPFNIQENSPYAKLAARKMRCKAIAMVLGNTIHLHQISRESFLNNKRLLKHELCHVRQYQQHGYFLFLLKYAWESCRKGYYNNRFEVEARAAEDEPLEQYGIYPAG